MPEINPSEVISKLADELRPAFRTMTMFVAGTLREAILSERVRQGTVLRQEELAAAFGVSRMPVREALRILEAEGLIDFSPHKGAVVAVLMPEDVMAVFDIRCALEVLAIRRSVPISPDRTFDVAGALLDEMDGTEDTERWLALHRRFHLSLCSSAPKRLLDLVAAQHDAIDRYLRIELAAMGNRSESDDEHRQLLAFCRARDVDAATTLLHSHIAEAGLELAETLKAKRVLSADRDPSRR